MVLIPSSVINTGCRRVRYPYKESYDRDATAISLLERVMADLPLTSLAKARLMNDANYAIAKAKEDADKGSRTRGQKMRMVQAKIPVYLKKGVEEGKPLPSVEITGPNQRQH